MPEVDNVGKGRDKRIEEEAEENHQAKLLLP